MKILVAGNVLVPYGAEAYIVKYLEKIGHDVFPFNYPTYEKDYSFFNSTLEVGNDNRELWFEPNAKWFHIVFSAQDSMQAHYDKIGINHQLLREGADNEIFYPINLQKEIDVIFTGSLYNNFRKSFVKELPYVCKFRHLNNLRMEKLNLELNKSLISINTQWDDFTDLGCSARFWEHASSGICILSPYWKSLENNGFLDGVHYMSYKPRDLEDLKSKVKYLLENKEIAKEIGINASKLIMARHTWAHRIDELFSILEIGGLI